MDRLAAEKAAAEAKVRNAVTIYCSCYYCDVKLTFFNQQLKEQQASKEADAEIQVREIYKNMISNNPTLLVRLIQNQTTHLHSRN